MDLSMELQYAILIIAAIISIPILIFFSPLLILISIFVVTPAIWLGLL